MTQKQQRVALSSTCRVGRPVGNDEPCFLIAEIAQNHDGSLGTAHAYIDAAADIGVDAIKFQTHIASAESTYDEPFRVKFSKQDATRFDYWRRMEFSAEQWAGLVDHAHERDLVFLSSPFSVQAVELLDRLGVPAWKVGSGEFKSHSMMDAFAKTGKPVLLSSGMSTWSEIDDGVRYLNDRNLDVVLLQCTSRYPTKIEDVGLNVLDEMRQRYSCPVGLSDHSGTVYPALAAMAQRAHVIEAHMVFDRRCFGLDVPASLTVDEMALVVQARDAFHVMSKNPVDKDAMAEAMEENRKIFAKSLAVTRPLPKGTVLQPDMLVEKKPATGISAKDFESVVNRRLARDVVPERLLTWEDLDEA